MVKKTVAKKVAKPVKKAVAKKIAPKKAVKKSAPKKKVVAKKAASKKAVWKFRSNNIIVTQPAKTGITAKSRNAVINHDQTNTGSFIHVIPGHRMLMTVTTTFNEARIDEIPIIWTEKIKKSVPLGA